MLDQNCNYFSCYYMNQIRSKYTWSSTKIDGCFSSQIGLKLGPLVSRSLIGLSLVYESMCLVRCLCLVILDYLTCFTVLCYFVKIANLWNMTIREYISNAVCSPCPYASLPSILLAWPCTGTVLHMCQHAAKSYPT